MPSSTSLNQSESIVVAIDGPAGAGKSTIAKTCARILKFSFLDTGAMYRSLTWKALKNNIDLEDEDALVACAQETKIDLEPSADGVRVICDGEDVSDAIRTIEVTNNTKFIARAPRVREIMVRWQREIAGKKSVVAEGRDIGTVVFPQSRFKFYLDADSKERCRRRVLELREKGKEVDEEKMLAEIIARDQSDFNRSVGPLKQADDAILIDSTQMSIDEVVDTILKYVEG